MARGRQAGGVDVTAMEMTKWFDTNYHYIVPELERGMKFRFSSRKPLDQYEEAKELGIETKPVLVGPLTFLLQGKCADEEFDRLELLDALVEVYAEVLAELGKLGAEWVQIDEPVLVEDRTPAELEALERAYKRLAAVEGAPKILIATYFDHVGEAYPVLTRLPVAGVGARLRPRRAQPRADRRARLARGQDAVRGRRLRPQRVDQRPRREPRPARASCASTPATTSSSRPPARCCTRRSTSATSRASTTRC